MTKPKPPAELKKRGRKAGRELHGFAFDNDGPTWVNVEARRELRRSGIDMGRALGSLARACEYLAQDLQTNTSSAVKAETLRQRYYRAAKRRRVDLAYAAFLDDCLSNVVRVARRDAERHGPGVAFPIFFSLNPK